LEYQINKVMESKYDYDFYLFGELWACMSGCAFLEYDIMFEQIVISYEEFLASKFNVGTKGLYECIQDFLKFKYQKDENY